MPDRHCGGAHRHAYHPCIFVEAYASARASSFQATAPLVRLAGGCAGVSVDALAATRIYALRTLVVANINFSTGSAAARVISEIDIAVSKQLRVVVAIFIIRVPCGC